MVAEKKNRLELEVGLRKAVRWIGERREEDPRVPMGKLLDEASLRFELSPVQADFLYRHLAKPPPE